MRRHDQKTFEYYKKQGLLEALVLTALAEAKSESGRKTALGGWLKSTGVRDAAENLSEAKVLEKPQWVMSLAKAYFRNTSGMSTSTSLVEVPVFQGRFFPSAEMEGFLPEIKTIKVMNTSAEAYRELFHRQVASKWAELSPSLCNSNLHPASLIHNTTDQHLYIMSGQKDGNPCYKIGISNLPGDRATQVAANDAYNFKDVEIVAIVSSGGQRLERHLHREFKEFRINGKKGEGREFFHPSEKLDFLINKIQTSTQALMQTEDAIALFNEWLQEFEVHQKIEEIKKNTEAEMAEFCVAA